MITLYSAQRWYKVAFIWLARFVIIKNYNRVAWIHSLIFCIKYNVFYFVSIDKLYRQQKEVCTLYSKVDPGKSFI